jgi:DNA segregation ATPase FtsK/SpoIIIE-like protein
VNADRTPHWLISGATGAGKTVALRSAVTQLAADPHNRLVVVDGKRGASFRGYHLAGMVAPVATEPDGWRAALAWAAAEMQARYDRGHDPDDRLIVVVDEVQEVIIADAAAAEAVRRLVVLGRDAGVHCLLATQHPIVKALGGPTVTRNLVGRLALRVADYDASRVAVGGSTPRADHLLGHGDAYAVAPATVQRVQVAYTTRGDLEGVAGDPAWDAWPETEAEDLGITSAEKARSPWPEPTELGAALLAAILGKGRPWLCRRAELGGITLGSTRGRRLLSLAQQAVEWLNVQDELVGWLPVEHTQV